jgi:hypothetical protein
MEHIKPRKGKTQAEFEPFGNTEILIAHAYANLKTTQELIQERKYVLMDYQDAFLKMEKYPRLKDELKDSWFYVNGISPSKSGHYNFNDNFESTGDLTPDKGDNPEKNVYVARGAHVYPLSIDVHNDSFARNFGRRYILDGQHAPDRVAPIILAVRTEEPIISKLTIASTRKGIALNGMSKEQFLQQYKTAELQISKVEEALGKENTNRIREFLNLFRRDG